MSSLISTRAMFWAAVALFVLFVLFVLMNAPFYIVFRLRKRLRSPFLSISPLGWMAISAVYCLFDGI
jgi:hypothetical protein